MAHYVALRAAGKLTAGQGARRPQLVDEFRPKLEELVDRSHGRIRADVAHRKLAAMGFTGCERTTRRAAQQRFGPQLAQPNERSTARS